MVEKTAEDMVSHLDEMMQVIQANRTTIVIEAIDAANRVIETVKDAEIRIGLIKTLSAALYLKTLALPGTVASIEMPIVQAAANAAMSVIYRRSEDRDESVLAVLRLRVADAFVSRIHAMYQMQLNEHERSKGAN